MDGVQTQGTAFFNRVLLRPCAAVSGVVQCNAVTSFVCACQPAFSEGTPIARRLLTPCTEFADGRAQESFEEYAQTGTIDDFLCARDTMQSMEAFLSGSGPPRLVVGCRDMTSTTTQDMLVDKPVVLVRAINSTFPPHLLKVVYFNRHARVESRPIRSPSDMLFGELSMAMLTDLRVSITDVCVPLIENAPSWGVCSPRNVESFRNNVEKFVGSLPPVANASGALLLPPPDDSLVAELKPGALVGTVGQPIVAATEILIEEWADIIEEVLGETRNKRGGADQGPRGELKFWKLRQRTLKAFFEQLKMPECAACVTVLMNSQSKSTRRWRLCDQGLTAAIAETKDAVKLMESLQPFFEELYGGAPASVSGALGIFGSSSKLFAACARHEGASMFFISLFQRVSVQVTICCNKVSRVQPLLSVCFLLSRCLSLNLVVCCTITFFSVHRIPGNGYTLLCAVRVWPDLCCLGHMRPLW